MANLSQLISAIRSNYGKGGVTYNPSMVTPSNPTQQQTTTQTPTTTNTPQDLNSYLNKIGYKGSEQDFWNQYGQAPEGGWTDDNIYKTRYDTGKQIYDPDSETGYSNVTQLGSANRDLQNWQDDPSILAGVNLYGSGSQEDINRGFNVLQYMAPRNIGEFYSLSPDVQKAILSNPQDSLQRMKKMANASNGDWLSLGAEGGFTDPTAYKTNNGSLSADPSKYMQIHDENNGLLGSVFSTLDPILDKIDPLHNTIQDSISKMFGFKDQSSAFKAIAPMVVNAFLPGVGSAISAADAASVGNDRGMLTNAAGAALGMSGGVDTGLGAAANSAATNAISSGINSYGSGGSISDIVKNAAMGGLAGYAGGSFGPQQLTQSFGFNPAISNALYAGGMNSLNQLFKTGNLDTDKALIAAGNAGLSNLFRG